MGKSQCYHFPVSRAGYVLTGGRSSRMGRDKALLPFRGGTLAQAVAAQVAEAAGSAILVGDPARYGGLGFPATADLYPGEGPLGGILTALHHTVADWNLVTACDMPAIEAALLRLLLDTAENTDPDVLIPAGPTGLVEPLCAVYHRRTLAALETDFSGGIRKIGTALEAVRVVRFPVVEVSCFQNINTPEEWSACER
jgi:molybdopterin-guanine dinucleotide biosynthesis protein A